MDARVQKVVAAINVEQGRRTKLSALAYSVNLSPWHLSHLFHREMRKTISDYRRNLRLETARRLLSATFLSVKEIMTIAGASDKSHFARDFKRVYGLSPTEYRRVTKNSDSDDSTMGSKVG